MDSKRKCIKFCIFFSFAGPSCETKRWRRACGRSITGLRTDVGLRERHAHRDAIQAETRHMWYVLRRPHFGEFPKDTNLPFASSVQTRFALIKFLVSVSTTRIIDADAMMHKWKKIRQL